MKRLLIIIFVFFILFNSKAQMPKFWALNTAAQGHNIITTDNSTTLFYRYKATVGWQAPSDACNKTGNYTSGTIYFAGTSIYNGVNIYSSSTGGDLLALGYLSGNFYNSNFYTDGNYYFNIAGTSQLTYNITNITSCSSIHNYQADVYSCSGGACSGSPVATNKTVVSTTFNGTLTVGKWYWNAARTFLYVINSVNADGQATPYDFVNGPVPYNTCVLACGA